MKRIIKTFKRGPLQVIVFGLLFFEMFLPGIAVAQQQSQTASTPRATYVASDTAGSCTKSFLGLEPWYYFLSKDLYSPTDKRACDLRCFNFVLQSQANACGQTKSDIPLVLLAVVDDLLRIAGLVTVGFVVYGAFQYTISQGSPEATSRAQTTIINSLIGLVIASISVAVVTFLGNTVGGSTASSSSVIKSGALPNTAASTPTIEQIIDICLNVIGGLALLIIVVAGLRYIISAGDPQKAATARNAIIYALVGLAIALSAEAIVAFVGNRI